MGTTQKKARIIQSLVTAVTCLGKNLARIARPPQRLSREHRHSYLVSHGLGQVLVKWQLNFAFVTRRKILARKRARFEEGPRSSGNLDPNHVQI